MKILSIVPTKDLGGGGERSFFELLCFLQQNGHDNYVIVPKNSSSDFLEALEDNKIKYIMGAYKSFELVADHSLNELEDIFSIVKILKKIKPSVFMTNLYIDPGQKAAAICNVPHIYFDRGNLGLQKNKNELSHAEPEFIKYANAIVCNSKNGQSILKKEYNTESSLVYSFVQHPGTELTPSDKPRIIMPANFFREKNHLDVLAAVARIKSQDPTFDTEIIFMGSKVNEGNSAYYTSVLQSIKELELQDLVKVENHQKQPWRYFSKSDIYINSGEGEAVGRATIEAEMLGLTALIANIPGHWEHKGILGNRHIFELHNIEDLAKKIQYLLDKNNRASIKAHNLKVQAKTLEWMTPMNTMGGMLTVLETIHDQKNPAQALVWDYVIDILKNARTEEVRLHEIDGLTATHIENVTHQLDVLRTPSIKTGIRLTLGAFKRAVNRQFGVKK